MIADHLFYCYRCGEITQDADGTLIGDDMFCNRCIESHPVEEEEEDDE